MTCSADYAKTYIDLTTDELVDAARAQAKAEAERIKADMECHSRFLGESIYVCFPSDFFTSPREGPVDRGQPDPAAAHRGLVEIAFVEFRGLGPTHGAECGRDHPRVFA